MPPRPHPTDPSPPRDAQRLQPDPCLNPAQYKTHIHPTGRADPIKYVVTEFSPNVSWAGKYNTINCAAGHHMLEGGWLRSRVYMDSYTRWWVTSEAKHNYCEPRAPPWGQHPP